MAPCLLRLPSAWPVIADLLHTYDLEKQCHTLNIMKFRSSTKNKYNLRNAHEDPWSSTPTEDLEHHNVTSQQMSPKVAIKISDVFTFPSTKGDRQDVHVAACRLQLHKWFPVDSLFEANKLLSKTTLSQLLGIHQAWAHCCEWGTEWHPLLWVQGRVSRRRPAQEVCRVAVTQLLNENLVIRTDR